MQKVEKGFINYTAIVWTYLFVIVLFFTGACQNPSTETKTDAPLIQFKGETMGTYYAISYLDSEKRFLKKEIDGLLKELNQSLSTYIPDSHISRFNKAEANKEVLVDEQFYQVFQRAKQLYVETEGAFDPTVMPLVNAWGFGYEKIKEKVDAELIDSLRQLVDFNAVHSKQRDDKKYVVVKTKKGLQLDFSAIAKGYGVDRVAQVLDNNKVHNYLVDIGGEVVCKGKNNKGNVWTVGIDKPIETLKTRELHKAISLHNKGIATSGNYRNFYIKDGKKYVHTINPKTGVPQFSNLLSATIIANDCMTADALATACMVMGFKKAKNFVIQRKSIDAMLIYADEKGELQTFVTRGVSLVE